jgi:hypothetical protein
MGENIMTTRLNDRINAKNAVAPTLTSGVVTGTKIDATGYGRARFVFTFGSDSTNTGSLMTGAGIWQATTSGGTFSSISSAVLAACTTGVVNNTVHIIDVPVIPTKPWLLVSNLSIMTSNLILAAIVELYRGVSLPPTSTATQIVVV